MTVAPVSLSAAGPHQPCVEVAVLPLGMIFDLRQELLVPRVFQQRAVARVADELALGVECQCSDDERHGQAAIS
jgi:hypothetical protein